MDHNRSPERRVEQADEGHRAMLKQRIETLKTHYKDTASRKVDYDYRCRQLDGLAERIEKNEAGEFDSGKFGNSFIEPELAEQLGFPIRDASSDVADVAQESG